MANLTPVSSFDPVRQLEGADIAQPSTFNAQAQALLNRTQHLKGQTDLLDAERLRLASTSSPSDGAAMVGVDYAGTDLRTLMYTVFGRTAAEIAAGVTPSNYAYPPRHSRRYGAVGDGSDETAKIQQLIDVCKAEGWAPAYIQDRIRLGSSAIIDRPVDTHTDEFRIIGLGKQAGFYTTGNVTMFDSSLSVTTDPLSEFVTFERIRFETSSVFNSSFVMSGDFLRIKFLNCFFWIIRCVNSAIYLQDFEFRACNIRNNPGSFITCDGSYAIVFDGGRVENGTTLFTCISTARGTSGLHLCGGIVIQGMQASTVIANGVSGFGCSNFHFELNASPMFNFWAGGPANETISIGPGQLYHTSGVVFSYGATDSVISHGVRCFTGTLHGDAQNVTNLVSISDVGPSISSQQWDTEFGSVRIKSPTAAARVINKRVSLTYSASMAIDARLGNSFDVLVTNATAFAFTAPTNPAIGQRIRITIYNTTGGALGAATFTGYKLGAAWTQPGANSNRCIEFEFTGAQWYEKARSTADVAN